MAKKPDSFVLHVLDMLEPVGPVTPRAMFGAWCVFLDGKILAIVEDGRLYLKVDDEVRAPFDEAGGEPFRYPTKSGVMEMRGYSTIPDADLDDRPAFLGWARLSAQASRRATPQRAKKKATRAKKRAKATPT